MLNVVMPSDTNKPFMLSVFMLNVVILGVVMLNVVAPILVIVLETKVCFRVKSLRWTNTQFYKTFLAPQGTFLAEDNIRDTILNLSTV